MPACAYMFSPLLDVSDKAPSRWKTPSVIRPCQPRTMRASIPAALPGRQRAGRPAGVAHQRQLCGIAAHVRQVSDSEMLLDDSLRLARAHTHVRCGGERGYLAQGAPCLAGHGLSARRAATPSKRRAPISATMLSSARTPRLTQRLNCHAASRQRRRQFPFMEKVESPTHISLIYLYDQSALDEQQVRFTHIREHIRNRLNSARYSSRKFAAPRLTSLSLLGQRRHLRPGFSRAPPGTAPARRLAAILYPHLPPPLAAPGHEPAAVGVVM